MSWAVIFGGIAFMIVAASLSFIISLKLQKK